MPDKHDHLTSQIDEAFKARTERMIAGHWASQRKIFEAGYRAGYAAAIAPLEQSLREIVDLAHPFDITKVDGCSGCIAERALKTIATADDADDDFIKQGNPTRKEQLRLKGKPAGGRR